MAEMKNKYQQKLKVLNKLFEAGCGSEKELQEMSLERILAIRGINMQDMAVIAELQKQVKGNHLFSYLSEVYRLEGKGEICGRWREENLVSASIIFLVYRNAQTWVLKNLFGHLL